MRMLIVHMPLLVSEKYLSEDQLQESNMRREVVLHFLIVGHPESSGGLERIAIQMKRLG